jgi:hypothetical protein
MGRIRIDLPILPENVLYYPQSIIFQTAIQSIKLGRKRLKLRSPVSKFHVSKFLLTFSIRISIFLSTHIAFESQPLNPTSTFWS